MIDPAYFTVIGSAAAFVIAYRRPIKEVPPPPAVPKKSPPNFIGVLTPNEHRLLLRGSNGVELEAGVINRPVYNPEPDQRKYDLYVTPLCERPEPRLVTRHEMNEFEEM